MYDGIQVHKIGKIIELKNATRIRGVSESRILIGAWTRRTYMDIFHPQSRYN